MKKWFLISLLGCLILGWQCQSGQENDETQQSGSEGKVKKQDTLAKATQQSHFKQKGVDIAQATGKALKKELTQAIADGGIENAIDYCSANAIGLTDSLSEIHGAAISRVTHKPRNPNNKADSLEMALIKKYQKQNKEKSKLKPELVQRNSQQVVYAPITIGGQLCLNCHGKKGKDIADEDYITIQLHYEDDQATGFEIGELRGMWKVAFGKKAS